MENPYYLSEEPLVGNVLDREEIVECHKLRTLCVINNIVGGQDLDRRLL